MSEKSQLKSVNWLNNYRIDILELRQFLASLNNEGDKEIGVGDLVVLVKAMSVQTRNKEIAVAE